MPAQRSSRSPVLYAALVGVLVVAGSLGSPAATAGVLVVDGRSTPTPGAVAGVATDEKPDLTASAAASRWHLPIEAPILVVRAFQPPKQRWLAGHRGVDLAADSGTGIVAAGPGVVSYSGVLAGRGVVTVTHGELRTTYEPVQATVSRGDRVQAGDQIGTLDAAPAHCPSRPCLHWGLLRGDTYLNPLSLLRRGPSVLLPVWRDRGG